MEDTTVICNCLNITVKDIKEAVENGASTVEEIQEATGAGTVCGVCIDEIEDLLKELKQ